MIPNIRHINVYNVRPPVHTPFNGELLGVLLVDYSTYFIQHYCYCSIETGQEEGKERRGTKGGVIEVGQAKYWHG